MGNTNTILRVEARRLRSKLKEYYANEGKITPVVIELAERGHSPGFRMRLEPQSHAPLSNSAPSDQCERSSCDQTQKVCSRPDRPFTVQREATCRRRNEHESTQGLP